MVAWTITAAVSPSADAATTTIEVKAVPDPLLSIGSSGGLIDYRFKFSRLPTVVVASTGQLFTQGPTTMVASARLDRVADYGRPPIADVPDRKSVV